MVPHLHAVARRAPPGCQGQTWPPRQLPVGARAQTAHVTTDAEVALLRQHITETFGGTRAVGKAQWLPRQLGAVRPGRHLWSIGVRYGGVQNVITRYRDLRALQQADPDQDSAGDLRATIADAGGPLAFADDVANHQLTSTRRGTPKSVAVDLAAAALLTSGRPTTEALSSADEATRATAKKAWLAVPGQRSGISWRYLLLLSGDQQVKPDRMIVRFVGAALDGTPTTNEAAAAVVAVAVDEGLRPRVGPPRLAVPERTPVRHGRSVAPRPPQRQSRRGRRTAAEAPPPRQGSAASAVGTEAAPIETRVVNSRTIKVTHDQKVAALRAWMARPGSVRIGPARPVQTDSVLGTAHPERSGESRDTSPSHPRCCRDAGHAASPAPASCS